MSTATIPGAETADTNAAGTEQWAGTNLAGDTVEQGIQKNRPEVQEDLRWWWRYSLDKKLSQAEAASELGVDGSTYSRVLRGEYKNPQGQVLPPPAKLLSRIRVLRQQLYALAQEKGRSRVMTPTVAEIHTVCRKAWKLRQMSFIFGVSHVGKSEALKWFRDENNHGRTLYIDLQGVTGVQDIYREFARVLGISADVSPNKLMTRVHNAIDRDNLVIVDEFHSITYAYQKGSSIRMVNALKSIKDRTGCAMVICATDVGRDEIETGRESKLLGQLWRRGILKCHLPPALRVGDVRAIAEAKGLPFPKAPDSGEDLWEVVLRDQTFSNGEKSAGVLCDRIAWKHGIEHLFTILNEGEALAKGRPLTWKHVIDAQSIYDNLSNRKRRV